MENRGSVNRWKETTSLIVIVTNLPAPYRIPLFNVLNGALSRIGLSLHVIFGAKSEARRQWHVPLEECEFSYTILEPRGVKVPGAESVSFFYPGLVRTLYQKRPVAVITDGFSVATTKLWLFKTLLQTKHLIWSGITGMEPNASHLARRIQRRILTRSADGFVAYGSRAKRFFLKLGAPESRISIATNTVDTRFFEIESERWKKKIGSSDEKVLLCVSNVTRGKNISGLLEVTRHLANLRQDFVLKIIGDGPEMKRCRQLVSSLGLERFVSFEGFKQRAELPKNLAESRCLVFPTHHDVWGLVVVEAMAAGVPCFVSLNAGVADDLIRHGENGFVVDFSDAERVARQVSEFLDNPALGADMAIRARECVRKNANLDICAQGFVRALNLAGAVKYPLMSGNI
ncbi:glycosyltransferase family 4 protein [Methylocaldum szegediense]|uniref:Glycosyltransferase family 1 protein n=1 Tax=Methylocaldum szegediense TaxID=73780 RepID=A0ABM9HZF3_9GAMM|nr:glycosyltransferase family 4 protein [Methylocaldum szegediense]CAI8789305.1 Glycosyltransferase family 1 protein [Methylocaldum szegediense]